MRESSKDLAGVQNDSHKTYKKKTKNKTKTAITNWFYGYNLLIE